MTVLARKFIYTLAFLSATDINKGGGENEILCKAGNNRTIVEQLQKQRDIK